MIFKNKAQSLIIDFCFECNVLKIMNNEEDFDPIRPVLVKFFKKVFSRDKVMASIDEE